MDYKEKYENALNRAKKFKEHLLEINDEGYANEIDCMFPELKVSEDERIRKALIRALKNLDKDHYNMIYLDGFSIQQCLAWLKKQGEQKPTDNVEPRFKVGDWIVFNNDHDSIYQVEKIENYEYTLRHILGGSMCLSFSHENMIRAWTIEDAKDGDVLVADDDKPFIFKGLLDPNHPNYPVAHCGFDSEDYLIISNRNVWWTDECVKPATIEQRNLLFSKMKEKGYEWDINKKELKKIEKIDEKHKVSEYFTGLIPCWINAPSTQQPAHNYHGKNIIAIHLKDGGYRCCCIDDKKPITFSLPENTPLVEGWKRKSAEWSDEDEKIIETMCKEGDLRPSQMIWLKSLKDRVQPRWKPTEEQLMALRDAIDNDELKLLYEQLKKL